MGNYKLLLVGGSVSTGLMVQFLIRLGKTTESCFRLCISESCFRSFFQDYVYLRPTLTISCEILQDYLYLSATPAISCEILQSGGGWDTGMMMGWPLVQLRAAPLLLEFLCGSRDLCRGESTHALQGDQNACKWPSLGGAKVRAFH